MEESNGLTDWTDDFVLIDESHTEGSPWTIYDTFWETPGGVLWVSRTLYQNRWVYVTVALQRAASRWKTILRARDPVHGGPLLFAKAAYEKLGWV